MISPSSSTKTILLAKRVRVRKEIPPKLHVHDVSDERPIPDIITNFAPATAAATVGEMTKNNMFEGTKVLPILYRETVDCTQHRMRDGNRLQLRTVPEKSRS